MFFTQEDFKKIEQWLQRNSVKDTEFQEADMPFNGSETVSVVQGNQNKKIFIKDLVSQIFNLGISDFVNITDKYDAPNISLEEAIRLIPSRARKEGQVITFLDREDHWRIYQFKGVLNQWNISEQWEDLFDWEKLIIDSILPDEEDLTKSLPDENGNSYLSLKDRKYNPEDFSGLGRIILRKNIVEVEDPIYGKVKKNLLYQDMFTQSNTIYEIRYDFDLNGKEITIPEGCVLDFQGGSLSNGTLIGKYYTTASATYHIFKKVVCHDLLNPSIPIEWFGGVAYYTMDECKNGVDSSIAIEYIQNSNIVRRKVLLGEGYYRYDNTMTINSGLSFEGVPIKQTDYGLSEGSVFTKNVFTGINKPMFIINNRYVSFKNVMFRSVKKADNCDCFHYTDNAEGVEMENCLLYIWRYGVYRDWSDGTKRTGFNKNLWTRTSIIEVVGGIYVDRTIEGNEMYYATNNIFNNCSFSHCSFGVYIKTNNASPNMMEFNSCDFSNIGTGSRYNKEIYSKLGCFGIRIDNYYGAANVGLINIKGSYFENICPYHEDSSIYDSDIEVLHEGIYYPKEDSYYGCIIGNNVSYIVDGCYFTNTPKYFVGDTNTSWDIRTNRLFGYNYLIPQSYNIDSIIDCRNKPLKELIKEYKSTISYTNVMNLNTIGRGAVAQRDRWMKLLALFSDNKYREEYIITTNNESRFLDVKPALMYSDEYRFPVSNNVCNYVILPKDTRGVIEVEVQLLPTYYSKTIIHYSTMSDANDFKIVNMDGYPVSFPKSLMFYSKDNILYVYRGGVGVKIKVKNFNNEYIQCLFGYDENLPENATAIVKPINSIMNNINSVEISSTGITSISLNKRGILRVTLYASYNNFIFKLKLDCYYDTVNNHFSVSDIVYNFNTDNEKAIFSTLSLFKIFKEGNVIYMSGFKSADFIIEQLFLNQDNIVEPCVLSKADSIPETAIEVTLPKYYGYSSTIENPSPLQEMYNPSKKTKEIFDGQTWRYTNGFEAKLLVGATIYRPTEISTGYQYYDTTLNKPVWWTGTAWIDATGAEV